MDSCASRACRRTTSGATLAFAVHVSSQRFLNCTPSAFDRYDFFSILHEIVEILRIDLQDDDNR